MLPGLFGIVLTAPFCAPRKTGASRIWFWGKRPAQLRKETPLRTPPVARKTSSPPISYSLNLKLVEPRFKTSTFFKLRLSFPRENRRSAGSVAENVHQKGAVRPVPNNPRINISKNNRLFELGALPQRPAKGLSDRPLETFGRKTSSYLLGLSGFLA